MQGLHGPSRHRRKPASGCRTRLGLEACERRVVLAAAGLLPAYDIGSPAVADMWVDPVAGDDAAAGATRAAALRTLAEAWRRVPARTPLVHGVRINLVAGVYAAADVPGYWESRHGSFTAPVILRAADGAGSARLPADRKSVV